jgi:iron complex outermembrane receptor protein
MRKTLRFLVPIIIPILFLSKSAFAQNTVAGVIKDADGTALVGSNVTIKGTKSYAVADASGQFSITTQTQPPFVLQVSSVGYKSQDIQVSELRDTPIDIILVNNALLNEVIVTSRRRQEVAQDIPIPIAVVGGRLIEDAGAFNVNRVKELVPSVQLYSSNPRNTTLNIRGLGSTYGLTNDGIDPGVGFYVDGVYYARPAAATLDFIDIERIEVLRGPQGTLFGKNTTAGAFNITTRAPQFKRGANVEVSYGNYNFIQAKASVTGPLSKKLAARLSFSGTKRDGLIYNKATDTHTNTLDNLGFRGQLLFKPTEYTKITLTGDVSSQHPDGYAQVLAGVAPTLRPAYRQFANIIKDLNYQLPTQNPFDRVIDTNTPWRSGNELGGVSLNIEAKVGSGTLTSTTAWRYWNWYPSSDRDFTGLPVLTLSQATSQHRQWTQEVRYAGELSSRLSGVIGVFAIGQDLTSAPIQIEESGSAQARFSRDSNTESDIAKWNTPGLLEGYGTKTTSELNTFGGAVFAQADWALTNRLHVLPGIRFNYDQKKVDYSRQTYGGLQTTDPALIAIQKKVYTNQAFNTDVKESNFSGQLTLAYKALDNVNTFATYSTSYKPVGVNLGGLPTAANGDPLLDLARVKPEYVNHVELGIKTNPTTNTTLNIIFYNTDITDFQTQVQTAEVGVNRGYLANAEKVRVSGIELDGNIKIGKFLSFYGATTFTDGKYVSFKNAPVPLEETGKTELVDGKSVTKPFKDISGGQLPGISKWAGSLGGEIASNPKKLLGKFQGKYFLALESYARSSYSSSASPSQYLNIAGYALVNARLGFRATDGLSILLWTRNLLNRNYFEQLLPAAGNAGHYAGVIGDPRTLGITLRYSL